MYGPREVELTPAAPAAFATLAEAKSFLGISGAEHDDMLTRALASASVAIEAFCNTVFPQRTVTEFAVAEDEVSTFVLRHAPVSAVASVSIAGTAYDVAEFRIMKTSGMVRRVDGAAMPSGDFEIEYTAGYATVPEGVKQAALEYVRDVYNGAGRDVTVASEDVPDVGRVSYASDPYAIGGPTGAKLSATVAAHLMPYVSRFAP